MVNIQEIFENPDVAKNVSVWLDENNDSTDLIGAAEYAAETRMSMVSVAPYDVKIVWPWLEKMGVKIMPRFYVNGVGVDAMSDMVMRINGVLKQGADGAQIIVKLSDMSKFADSIALVREDLFFNKCLGVGVDMFEIWPNDWAGLFENLKKMSASALLLILTHDDMDKSDFVGRIYGALDAWDTSSNMELHVMLGTSHDRAEQVYRLVSINRPELLNKLKFFVSY